MWRWLFYLPKLLKQSFCRNYKKRNIDACHSTIIQTSNDDSTFNSIQKRVSMNWRRPWFPRPNLHKQIATQQKVTLSWLPKLHVAQSVSILFCNKIKLGPVSSTKWSFSGFQFTFALRTIAVLNNTVLDLGATNMIKQILTLIIYMSLLKYFCQMMNVTVHLQNVTNYGASSYNPCISIVT